MGPARLDDLQDAQKEVFLDMKKTLVLSLKNVRENLQGQRRVSESGKPRAGRG